MHFSFRRVPRLPILSACLLGVAGVVFSCAWMLQARPVVPPAVYPMTFEPQKTDTPTELGLVKWNRGFDAACKVAKDQGKPVLILFSEVPGCATCKGYGEKVMSHPLVVEAAEMLFVPVAVYNNIEGDDRKTLDSFKEPTWNNPVVRVVAADRTPLTDRVDGDYTVAGVAKAMTAALKAAKKDVPAYLSLLAEEEVARSTKTETAVFAVHCFWEGDQKFGELPGVVGTSIGFLDGQEVVEVKYAPSKLTFADLRKKAAAMSCATRIYARNDAQAASKPAGKDDKLQVKRSTEAMRLDKVQKYHLSNSLYKHVPMTELQACRVNAAIASSADAPRFLSPRQQSLYATIQKNQTAAWPECVGETNLVKAWADATKISERIAERVAAEADAHKK